MLSNDNKTETDYGVRNANGEIKGEKNNNYPSATHCAETIREIKVKSSLADEVAEHFPLYVTADEQT